MDIVEALRAAESPVLVTHQHADRDSLGSAIGLRALLGRGTVCTPTEVAGPAKALLEAYEIDPINTPAAVPHDAVVVLDAPSAARIAPVDPSTPLLIDHHEAADLAARATASLVDPEAGATAELIVRLAETADWPLSPAAALPLLVGLLDDTGFLSRAGPDSITTAVELVGALGDRSAELPPLLDRSPVAGERSARALGTLRARGYQAGELIVAVTHIGAHEGDVATTLRAAGVDLAVVCSEQSDALRVTTRASDAFTERLSLGDDILPALAAEFGGDGGGHDGAAGANLDTVSRDAVEAFLLTQLEAALGVTFGEVS